jgi:integrase
VSGLNSSHVKDGYIAIKTKKRKKFVEIPLFNRALRLIREYENEKLFAKPLKQSNSRVNTDIEDLMEIAGIRKHIPFHCSRHLFAINSLILEISLLVVSDIFYLYLILIPFLPFLVDNHSVLALVNQLIL